MQQSGGVGPTRRRGTHSSRVQQHPTSQRRGLSRGGAGVSPVACPPCRGQLGLKPTLRPLVGRSSMSAAQQQSEERPGPRLSGVGTSLLRSCSTSTFTARTRPSSIMPRSARRAPPASSAAQRRMASNTFAANVETRRWYDAAGVKRPLCTGRCAR